jgi:formiminoglutamase
MHFVETVIEQVKASGKLMAADMAELNPNFDRDGQTARVGARLLARVAGLGQ